MARLPLTYDPSLYSMYHVSMPVEVTSDWRKFLYGFEVPVVSSYKESRNNMPIYGYMLPNLSPSSITLYQVQSVHNNNVTL